MKETYNPSNGPMLLKSEKRVKQSKRRGPGRGIGEKRLTEERLNDLSALFHSLEQIHAILIQEGHSIINESGSMLSSGSHQNLDQMLLLLEDFLWTLNCALAKNGGNPRLLR
ncbi:MAG: hypothetical protein ACFE9D_01015 [Promethearchaeota archaeon]